uniref:C-type lectin domain-containing protein n=1 Tax=Daphnia galeata TaxID=27404 RepID=A0A8J2WJ67_9CRUS|nr:unnamed protein product [Daphnia galeata]
MTRFSILCSTFILSLSSSISGNVLVPRDVEGCGGSLFVEDAVVIDAPLSANCKWKIQTDEKQVLVFTVVHNGNFRQVEEFLSRDQASQTTYCNSNAMKLLVIESYEEEQAIQAVWGTTSAFWTSCSDKQLEGKWIWESTGLNLYPGYANWADGEPRNAGGNENCITPLQIGLQSFQTSSLLKNPKMTSFSILGVFILAISSSISGNVLLPRDVEKCGGSLFVDDAVVIDVPLSANCKWQIQTEKDRVLVFTVVQGGNFKQVEDFLSRNHASQTSYCNSHAMKLLAIESYAEEQAIYAAWTTDNHFWTSGTDISVEGKWIWESTGVNLSPGYSNWASGEPNDAKNEDCLSTLSTLYPQGWLDFDCSISHEAICEAHS